LRAAAFYGKHEAVRMLVESGVDVNRYFAHGFHTHASPLHQAVFSGCFETVKLLVEAGADLQATDKVYHGTTVGWATHMLSGIRDESTFTKFAEIESYLKNKNS
jgi:peptide-methionine (S)-S-oxide reductase